MNRVHRDGDRGLKVLDPAAGRGYESCLEHRVDSDRMRNVLRPSSWTAVVAAKKMSGRRCMVSLSRSVAENFFHDCKLRAPIETLLCELVVLDTGSLLLHVCPLQLDLTMNRCRQLL